MLRLALPLLIVALLAACSGAPQKTARGSGGSYASSGGAYRTMPPGLPHFVDHSIGREEISIQAMGLVGVPYRWGGNTPDSGFDCSGLVHYVVQRAASVNLPRRTADMSSRGESVEPDEIAPGDLIFFNTTGRPHSHVGIYVGKLRFVNAPSTGGTVRLDYLTNPYWAKRFDGIRRVAPALSKPTTPFDTPSYQAAAPELTAPAVATVAPSKPAAAYDTAGTQREAASANAMTANGYRQGNAYAARSVQQPSASVSTTAAASTHPFEPPPPGLSAAQMQARAAGAVSPAVDASPAPADAQAPDAIDAAADAYEPPPPASIAARQARQARQASDMRPSTDSGGVQIMRASTASRPIPAPTHTNDDPIAGFANGGY
jgi:hypothetical protein